MSFAPDYIQVNERLIAFREKYPDGCVQAEIIELSDARVTMRAMAYRTPDDARPGIGHSSLAIPGLTPYTRGSELENCETSAWGRALAALGFEVKRAIASAEEVAKAAPAIALAKTPAQAATDVAAKRAARVADPLAEARAIFDEPPLPTPPAEFAPQRIIPPAPHGGWSEGQIHAPGHKGLRARQNGSLFCPSKMPDGGWCAFRTDQP
jgi:hypothetical protein